MTCVSSRTVAWPAALLLGSGASLQSAFAQNPGDSVVPPEIIEVPASPDEDPNRFRLSLGGGMIHEFDTDIDGGGEFAVTRVSADFNVRKQLSDSVSFGCRLYYGLDMYDFTDAAGLASSGSLPWEDIHTVGITTLFNWSVNHDLTLFGGPVIQSSRESGADIEDSITGGAVVGGSYAFSPEFSLGGGFIITSQIEDDARIDPFIAIRWQAGDSTRVASRSAGNILTHTGVEFIVDAGHGFEVGFGVATYFSRFRLDDEDVAPDGVGQDESIPLWVRAGWQASSNVRLEGAVGVALNGTLRLEDDNGDFIAEQDYDPAPFVGFFVGVTF